MMAVSSQIHSWRELLGWNSEQIDELRCAGYRYIVQGKYRMARLFFEALVILQPGSLYDLRTLGAIYLELGHPQRALSMFARALKRDPKHEPTQLNRAKALFDLGQKDKALKISQALKKSKISPIANEASALELAFR